MMTLREMTKLDKILIIFLLASSLNGLMFISVLNTDISKKDIVIKVENKTIKRISIDKNTDNKTFSFQFGNNTGYIEVKNGAVKMQEMPKSICPEKICSDTGWISKKYQTIVCLPNKIVVSLEQGQEEDIDTLSF